MHAKEYDNQFRHYTNLSELIIREGAKVMFLTNKLFSEPVEELCNGSIGVITKLIFERKL
jgi:ATP-dependent exoDNAse (exonuclease V) alpha subunit